MSAPADREKVADTVTRVLGGLARREPESLTPGTHLFLGLGLTSGNALELIMLLEDELALGLSVEAVEWQHLETVGSLTDYLVGRAAAVTEEHR